MINEAHDVNEKIKIVHRRIEAKTIKKCLKDNDNPYIIDWCDLLSSASGGDKLQFIYESKEAGNELAAIDVRLTLGYALDSDMVKEQEELNKLLPVYDHVSPECVK